MYIYIYIYIYIYVCVCWVLFFLYIVKTTKTRWPYDLKYCVPRFRTSKQCCTSLAYRTLSESEITHFAIWWPLVCHFTIRFMGLIDWPCNTIVSYFRIVRLSILSVPTVCLKDPQTRNDSIHLEILLTVRTLLWMLNRVSRGKNKKKKKRNQRKIGKDKRN